MVQVFPPAASPADAASRSAEVDRLLEAELFKALAEPRRIALVSCLLKCRRPCSVTELAECCDIDFSVVARHLGVLARAGVLESSKSGREVRYAVRVEAVARHFAELSAAISAWPADSGGCCNDGGCC